MAPDMARDWPETLANQSVEFGLFRYDHRDIGEILGLTETNTATRLSRPKQRLRREVAPGPGTSQEPPHGTR